jgi:predicted DNA-binding transcriptional regulator YafY
MNSSKKSVPRLEFIESLLYWEGKVHRRDLVEKLGISAPQASLDLKEYRRLSPENITYDPGTRYYAPTKEFIPKFYEPNAYAYLGNLLQYKQKLIDHFNPAFGSEPNNTSITVLTDSVDANVIRQITQGIKTGKRIEISYQGMEQKTEISKRWITPTILFYDGMRWQSRAFCYLRKAYRTFTLSRIVKIHKIDVGDNLLPPDEKWDKMIDVILIPGPHLTPEQQQTIQKIFNFDNNGEKIIPVRVELLPYFLIANRLYPFSQDDNIVLKNREEIKEIINDKPILLFR